MGTAIAAFNFGMAHWTDICTILAVVGHFFQQKTVVAKLGEIADAAKNNPPSFNKLNQ